MVICPLNPYDGLAHRQGVQNFFSAAVHDLGIKIGRTLLHEKGVACNQYIMW